jgi:hypothetical protein
MRKRLHLEERGQVLILGAAMFIVVLAAGALAIDVGNMTFQKGRIQNAADAAALAGVVELPLSSSAAQSVARDYNGRNGVENAESVITVTESDTRITVTNTRNVPFFLAKVFGISSGDVEATASAKAMVANGFVFDDVDVMPYIVWAGNPGQVLNVGDTVVFFSNQYEDANNVTGPNWTAVGNGFKGFLKHGGEIIYVGPNWQTFSNGGSACGPQPIEALQDKLANNATDFIVLPVVDRATGNGNDRSFRIIAWVAVKVTLVDCPQTHAGVILGFRNSPEGYTDGSTAPSNNVPPVYTSRLVD